MENYIRIVIIVFFLFYYLVLQRKELQMLQQNSYRNKRYLRWLKNNLWSFRRISDLVILCLLLVVPHSIILYLATLYFVIQGIRMLRVKSKKPLVFTARVKRLFTTSLVLILLFTAIGIILGNLYWGILAIALFFPFSFVTLLFANILLIPCEKLINRWYYNDAKRILSSMPNLTIIGITGSYGKTSTKHFLHTILAEKYNVLMTPGSYNTTLGVIRTIREQLKSYHNVFIVEMGAKQIGDIKEICDLVHPSIGILTAVGEQHLESFKTIANIQKTKFELVDALPANGFAVVNDDFEYIANRPITNVPSARYSFKNTGADFYLKDVSYDPHGSHFTLTGRDTIENINSSVLGDYNLSDILAAAIVALHLKMTSKEIIYGISKIQPVEHRLSTRHTLNGITIIDDAFNSNPQGARMALDIIKSFKNQKIVITPGLIELGDKQYHYNQTFGQQLAQSCDYAIIVGKYNKEAIVAGLKEKDFPEDKLFLASSLQEAVKYMQKVIKTGDVVLYENDLPDTFK